MIEQVLTKDEFIKFILEGSTPTTKTSSSAIDSALPEGFEDFDGFPEEEIQPTTQKTNSNFAGRLLEASGFGYPEQIQRENVIRSDDAVARYLPDRLSYWPKTTSRPYQTLLFESELNHRKLLEIPAFKNRQIDHLDIVEDALARMVSEALKGFQTGGETVTADVRKGNKDETLCIVSILDEREGEQVRLVCFGTQNKSTGGLETFQITEQTRLWERQLAYEYLGLLYERQFKKLISQDWQEAFTTTDERKQAEKLLEVCTREEPSQSDIREGVLDLLEKIARSFGLRKKSGAARLLQVYELPPDHDIGIDPEELENSFSGQNPFGGVTIRDGRNCLLGYIIYPLENKTDAARLTKYLEQHNRFHNVLVVYPDQKEAHLELWQGNKQLTGKLRKGQGHKDAASVVNLLSRFFVVSKAKVKNPRDLAEELAYRARYLHRLAVKQLQEEKASGHLRELYNAFKEALIHDQTEDQFADAFAQTITYGLLTARWIARDMLITSNERFTRHTALVYLNSANPFLENLFESVLDAKHGQRIRLLWLVEDIAALLERVDVIKVFGTGDAESDKATDPIIHFYEPFLAAYNKDLKNKRGVFFTPRPVVSYIVRSVHELLQTEFKLEDGLASTDTWGNVQKNFPDLKLPEGVKAEDPFVCILDPATGTGTFLFECIELIERTMKDRWCKELKKNSWKDRAIATRWNEYVTKHLLPRLYGYEFMMASYAIAHLKLSFKLNQTGYKLKEVDQVQVYLTNSLDPASDEVQQKLIGMFPGLARESQAVNKVKRTQSFSVVLGNPPYAQYSMNLSEKAKTHIEKFRFANGERIRSRNAIQLERNLNDDYVKFLGFAFNLLKNGIGVIGIITNRMFLDSESLVGLREWAIKNFDRIFIIDLWGSSEESRRVERLFGDENVFDIQQGVSISFYTKFNQNPEKLSTVFHKELIGKREYKYQVLNDNLSIKEKGWFENVPSPKMWWLHCKKSNDVEEVFGLAEAFPKFSTLVASNRDHLVVNLSRDNLLSTIQAIQHFEGSNEEWSKEFDITLKSNWNVTAARKELKEIKNLNDYIYPIEYRPFDRRWIFFHKSLVWQMAPVTSFNVLENKNNIVLVSLGKNRAETINGFWITSILADKSVVTTRDNASGFPLYLHLEKDQLDFNAGNRYLNLAPAFIAEFCKRLKMQPVEPWGLPHEIFPESLLHYIYALLYSQKYRKQFAHVLTESFPPILFPADIQTFNNLAHLGSNLAALHLLESKILDSFISEYFGVDRPEIDKPVFERQVLWLNNEKKSGFKGIPEDIWNFYIGGYQVCKKWLESRKGRTLSQEDIEHYQKIIVALSETIRIMQEIDEVIDEHGGWPDAFAKGVVDENG